MLEDRDYMRQPEFGGSRWTPRFQLRWSWTVVLLAVYLIVFVAEIAAAKFAPQSHFFSYLALSKEGMERGYFWQLVTYQFMHAGWLHLLLNCWAIFTFGRELETLLGEKKFLALVFSSGIVGGVFQVLVSLLWPDLFGDAVVGASACAFGLVAAFALIFPERELTMLVFFVIPVHLPAKTLLLISAVLAVTGIVFPWDNVANAAHLGGMVMGWFFVRRIMRSRGARLEGTFQLFPYREQEPSAHMRVEKSPAEIVAEEVDPILDKISAQGIQSLTAREREVLESARRKMAGR
ncbi:MAG: rhomboid family intramembrane serine protease [Verrucomicrobiota bacterium]